MTVIRSAKQRKRRLLQEPPIDESDFDVIAHQQDTRREDSSISLEQMKCKRNANNNSKTTRTSSAMNEIQSIEASVINEEEYDAIKKEKVKRNYCWRQQRPLASETKLCEQINNKHSINSNTSKQHHLPTRQRKQRELTSFLTLLFGIILLIYIGISGSQLSCCRGDNLIQTINRTAAAASIETTTIAPDDLDNNDDEEEQEQPVAERNNNRTRLGELISDAAASGADLLVARLQTSSSSSDENSDNDTDNDQDQNDLESPPSLASTTNKQAQQITSHNAKKQVDDEFESTSAENESALNVYMKWRATGDDLIELFSRKLMPTIIEHGYDVDPTTMSGLLQVFNGIRQLKGWALKLLDASAKLTPGILIGTQSDFGDFDECLNVRVDDPSGFEAANSEYPVEVDPRTGLKSTTLVGKYCFADVLFPKPLRERAHLNEPSASTVLVNGTKYKPIELRKTLFDFARSPMFKDTIFVETGNFFHMLYVDPIRVGVCLTNKIDPKQFEHVVNKLLADFQISINFHSRCVTKYDPLEWTLEQRVSAHILVIACALVALSTILDLLHTKLDKLPGVSSSSSKHRTLVALGSERRNLLMRYRPLFTSFSLIRNTKRLFKCSNSSSKTTTTVPPHVSHMTMSLSSSSASCTTTSGASSLVAVDSSVESSPVIERRTSASTSSSSVADSSVTAHSSSSTTNLINVNNTKNQTTTAPVLYNHHTQLATSINLNSLHGLRVLTMTWMIVNHTYMFGGFFVLWAHRRLIDIAEWPKSLSFQIILNGWLTVETYFFLSALIIVLSVMPLMRANKFNYFQYILHRLLRLLPAYVGLVCLNFLWPLISSGPVWLVKGKSFVQTPCEQYLWTNFLFINNWIWPEKQCMVHTWFLSADFQLYIVAPVIVYLLYRRPALGHSLNLLVAVCASILSGFVIYANKLLPTTLINKLEFDAIKQQLSYSYFATYQHIGPYCLGILTGYLLHKRPHIQLPRYLTCTLWLLLPPLSFTTLLLTYLWNGAYDDRELVNPSPLVSAFYVAIHRTIWTSLVAWLVFACCTHRAKLMASFLSHNIFIPISRLSYSIYLVHLPVIMFRALNVRHTIEWSDQNILWEACGNFVASLFMGYFLNVVFESPVINLENYLLKSKRCNQRIEQQQRPSTVYSNNLSAAVANNHCIESCLSGGSKCAHHLSGVPQQSELTQQQQQKSVPKFTCSDHCDRRASDCSSVESSASSSSGTSDEQQADVPSRVQKTRLTSDESNTHKRGRPRPNVQQDYAHDLAAEYRHYAPAGYRQWRMSATGRAPIASARTTHYATLARNSRFNAIQPQQHNDAFAFARRTAPIRPVDDNCTPSYQAAWDALPASSRGFVATGARRQGRYNTLTGSDPWRTHYNVDKQQHNGDDDDDDDDDQVYANQRLRMQRTTTPSSLATWLQQHNHAAGLLPRIDSSTLRRQARRHHHQQQEATNSIAEEESAAGR